MLCKYIYERRGVKVKLLGEKREYMESVYTDTFPCFSEMTETRAIELIKEKSKVNFKHPIVEVKAIGAVDHNPYLMQYCVGIYEK